MNFICKISNTLIDKGDSVRIFFLESQINDLEPFMSLMSPQSFQNFIPVGVPFKAVFEENDLMEVFNFEDDKKTSETKSVLLNYLNEIALSKAQTSELNLLNHWSKELSFGKLNSLSDVWDRLNKSALYIDERGNFITAMIIREDAYQIALKHSNYEQSVARMLKTIKTDKYIKLKEHEDKMLQNEIDNYTPFFGTKKVVNVEVDIIVSEETIADDVKELEADGFRFNKEEIEGIVADLRKELGSHAKRYRMLETFIDQAFIDKEVESFKELIYGRTDTNAIKKDARGVNSLNHIIDRQIQKIAGYTNFEQSDWSIFVEAYSLENFFENSGFEFLPSRKAFPYFCPENKAFFETISKI